MVQLAKDLLDIGLPYQAAGETVLVAVEIDPFVVVEDTCQEVD